MRRAASKYASQQQSRGVEVKIEVAEILAREGAPQRGGSHSALATSHALTASALRRIAPEPPPPQEGLPRELKSERCYREAGEADERAASLRASGDWLAAREEDMKAGNLRKEAGKAVYSVDLSQKKSEEKRLARAAPEETPSPRGGGDAAQVADRLAQVIGDREDDDDQSGGEADETLESV